jgi:hypothetical protein
MDFSQDNMSFSHDLNRGPPDYEVGCCFFANKGGQNGSSLTSTLFGGRGRDADVCYNENNWQKQTQLRAEVSQRLRRRT